MRLGFATFLITAVLHGGTIISLPDAAYTSGTNLVSFTDPDESMIGSIGDGNLTISFSSVTDLMRASTVGDDWSTWGAPPNTESSTPRVLWSGLDDNFNPITTVTFLLSAPVAVFGFEAEPDALDVENMVATFYMGATVEQTISLDVNGNGGALLFAAAANPGTYFDSVTLTSDVDFAAGQFRYAMPEPATYVSMLAGLAAIFGKKYRGAR
jgi:hypothetical protein